MMDSLDKVEELARLAREDAPVAGEVRDAVLARLRETAAPRFSDAPLLLFTAAYAAAAVAMLAVAAGISGAATDPLAPLFALAQTLTL